MDDIIRASNLGKKYDTGVTEVNALVDVTLNIKKGEFVAVMGASGSGKSTLLHILGGLDHATTGEIHVRDLKLRNLNDKAVTLLRRKHIGFVFQFYNLVPTLTAEENIALPHALDGKRPQEYKQKVEDLLNLVGLYDRRQHRPDELSGGEQQRVALARALVTEPAIILADEPSGNLNTKAGDEVLKLLRKSCDEMGQTIIMVTHDPKAATFADRVIFLKDGQIAGRVDLSKDHDIEPIINEQKKLEI